MISCFCRSLFLVVLSGTIHHPTPRTVFPGDSKASARKTLGCLDKQGSARLLRKPAWGEVWVAPISSVHLCPLTHGSTPERLWGFTWHVPILQASLGAGNAAVALISGPTPLKISDQLFVRFGVFFFFSSFPKKR